MKIEYVKELVPLDAVKTPTVREGIAYWQGLCRGRAFPARADVNPGAMRKLLSNALLLRVIDGGADYEYRIAGQNHVEVNRIPLQGVLLSKLGFPDDYLKFLKSFYDDVVRTRAPFAVRCAITSGGDGPMLYASENALLPLGDDGQSVDHVLVFTVFETAPPKSA